MGSVYRKCIDFSYLDAVDATIPAAKSTNTNEKCCGLPEGKKGYISNGTRDSSKSVAARNADTSTYISWPRRNPELAKMYIDAIKDNTIPIDEILKVMSATNADAVSTLVCGYSTFHKTAILVQHHKSGSAGLHGPCRNYLHDSRYFITGFNRVYNDSNLFSGTCEYSVRSILNGLTYHGIFRASRSTFTISVDYFCPTILVDAFDELRRIGRTRQPLKKRLTYALSSCPSLNTPDISKNTTLIKLAPTDTPAPTRNAKHTDLYRVDNITHFVTVASSPDSTIFVSHHSPLITPVEEQLQYPSVYFIFV